MEDSRKKLYDTLSKSYNLGTFEEFNDKMGYEESRKKLYDTVSEKYNLGDFDTFNQKMGTTYQADKEALEQQMDEWGASNGSFMKEYEDAEELYKSQSVFWGSGAIDTPQSIFVYDNAQEYGKKRSEIEEMRRRYYSNPLVIKQREGDAGFARQMAEGFATEAKRVEQENPELARKAKAANAAALNPRGAMTGYIADDVKQYNEDRQNYETARRMAESAQDIYAAPSKYDDSIGVVNFLKGGRDVANKADFWTMGMVGIADNLNARDALMKVQEKLGSVDDLTPENIDSILTPSEKAIVTAFATNVMAQASRANDLSRGYQAGQGAMESLGFMAQFLLTQGLGSAAAKGASKGIAKAVSKGATDSMTKWLAGQLGKISSSTVKSATKSAAKGVVGTIESVVKASVMTPMIPQTWKTVSDEMLEINDAGKLQEASTAFWHGLGDAMIETWSENAGGMVEKILGVPLSAGKSVWNKALGKTDFGKWGANLTRTPAYNLMRQAGWNGFIAEMGEEFVGNTVRTVTGLDPEALQDFSTVDNLLVTAASFAPMTIIGLGTSAAQYGAAKKRATKAAEHLAQVMKGAGYTPEQIAFTLDDMNASTPVQLSQSLTPVVNQIAKDSGQGSYVFKAAMEYADAMARYRTLDGFYNREQAAQIEDARENIMANTGQQFWQTKKVADGVTTDNVRVITTKEGIRMFVTGESEDGMLAVVKENGEKRFITPDQLANTAGPIPEGEVIVSDESMSLNDFLRSEVVSKKKDAEQQRMSEEANAAIETIRQAARPGTQINLGTAEVPVIGNIVQQIPDGVVVQSEAGVSQLTWEEAGNAMNIAVKPMTDAEIEQQEIDAIEAERAAKEFERAKTEQEAVQAGATEIVSTEEAEDALPLPLKADGSVDQTALWNQSPERWARWNDDQRQDDGINSANYISSALARAQKDLDQTVKAYGNESDFDARASLESDIAAKQERVNRLAALQQSYIPQEAMQEAQAEQTSVPAKPLSSQQLKEKQKPVERTLESEVAHLYELGLNNEEVAANLDAKIAKAQKDLEAQSKKAPLMEADAEAYIEKKRKYEEKMSALQQEADFWSEAKEAVNNLRAQETQMPEAPSEVALESDPEPQNGVELAARELGLREGGIKLLWDSFEHHTGYGSSERSKFFGLFRTKAKGGMTIEQAGERLMELDRENNTGFFDQNDPNAGTNAILDALSDNDTIGQLRSYVARQRKAEAEREAKAAYSSMNAYYEQTFGEKLEDTALYDEIRSAEILASGLSESEQQELNNIIFAEEISQYGTEGYQTEASGVYESEVAGNAANVEPGAEGIRTESVGVLQGAQSDNSGRDAEPEEGQRGSEGESSEQDALPSVPSGESATAVESSLDEDMPDFSNQIEQVREEVDADPSEAQKKAGNYKMGHLHLDGYNITIENPKGSVRRGTDSKGNEWENTLNNDYGYIRGTEGVDGDHIDVYLSDNPAEGNVYVIDQVNPETREFDEHKVMYGFNSIDEAREAYLANFSEGWNGLGTITEVAKDEFKKWIDSSHRKTKPFSEYKSVNSESAQSSEAQLSDEEVTRKAVEFFTPGSKTLALRERIDSWVSKLGVKVNVMESIDDVKNAQAKALIKKGGKVWGWFESATGEVYIYLPDFASLDLEAGLSEIDKTYIHEIVSHQGLRGLLGQEKYDELCDKLWESLTEEEKKDALARPGVNGDKRKAADEHIAYFSETINYESNPSAWDKIVSIVIDILKSIGIQVGITDSDLASLLRASYQKLATEAQTKPEKKSESKPKKTSKVKAEKAADEKIEDFGEKIGGARKDVARAKIRDSVKLSQKDLIELKDPDKILSRKNIIKYYADGAMTYEDAVKLLAMNMAVRGRDAIDRGVAMKKYRSLALAWESGAELVVNITDEDVQDRMNEFSERMRQAPDFEARTRASLEQFVLKVYNDYKRTYEALEYPEVYRNLKSAYIRYGDHDGKYWVVGGPSSYRGWPFPTLEQAVAKIEKIYPVEAVAKKPSESKNEGEKSSSILVTKDRAGYYRIKSRNIPGEIYLSGKMYSKKDAETFLAENYDKLVERENKLTEALLGSNIGMVEREGIDYRKGKDVTPKDFLDTFGFRGVEFGNWVPQVERQAYLNKTYDAIMDFCHIVGISPKAFSLGGRLGLAFGARGKSRALAHYEPLKEVINLTRMKGAGSLAHEWFHALDNYLAKQKSGNVSDMATDKKPAVRQEVTDALNAFVAAMNRLEYTRRSNRAGQYWGEVWERAARLFESYIYNELGGQNTVSPLLVKKDTLYVDQGEYSDDAWPYPSAEENAQMKPFFDNIFATLQEQIEKDGSVTLFRAEEVGRKQAQLDVINETNPMIDDYHVGIRNVEDIKTFDEVMEEARRESEKGGWSELASYPDISNDMLEDALETRRIVIYSSHPIANGVFVTPSYMQADEYSGMTGEVYSKDVSVDDIAWINTDEGQFASLNDAIQKYDGTPDNETSFRGVTPAMDAEYIAAVNRGDMETAQRMVNRAASMAGYDSSSEYQGSIAFNGAAPSSNPYYESKEERKEAWENGDYEGDMSLGDYVDFGIDTHDIEWQLTHPNALRSASASGRTSILNLRNAVNSKDRKIKIYRAVDANIKEGSIRNGDWVTPSRSYAQEHIYMQSWKKGRIIEQEVSIDDLWWDGNDINEWGYDDGKEYAYKDTKNNRKLLNAVTYDDNGNVIPLSKRFNPRKEDVRFRAVWHGSGAEFSEFDHSFMGEGEGLQAYGWGTYVTESEQVGRGYAKRSARSDYRKWLKPMAQAVIDIYDDYDADPDFDDMSPEEKLDNAKYWAADNNPEYFSGLKYDSDKEQAYDLIMEAKSREELEALKSQYMPDAKWLYNVEIPDDDGTNYLRWDKDVPQKQLERIANGLKEYGKIKTAERFLSYRRNKGEDVYHRLERYFGSDKKASLFLDENGFVGVSMPVNYLAGGNAQGLMNYVIFREDNAQIQSSVRFRATEITPEVRDEMDRIAATAIFDGNYMLAPNGQPTKLTADQWAMVRTENFKRWFGDWINDPENASKVVDENGEPRVVYHGSPNAFTAFDKDMIGETTDPGFYGQGFYFATTKAEAKGYGKHIIDAFVSLENPLDLNAVYEQSKKWDGETADGAVRWWYGLASMFPEQVGDVTYASIERGDWTILELKNRIDELAESSETPFADAMEEFEIDDSFFDWLEESDINIPEEFTSALVANGYDGVINAGAENNEIVALEPNQIKSATDNTGEFSAEEGDIRFRAEEPRTAPSKDEVPEIIDDLFEQADSSKNKVQRKIISSVTPRQLEEYRKKGILNVTADFVHSIENTALRHENKRHSGDNRTQQPLTKEEWHNILDVIENFDTVEKQKSRSGLDVIVYKKKNNDGTIYYVEEIRTGRKSLALTTAYKKRGDSSELMADALPQTSETTLDNTSFDGKDSDYLDNNNSYEVDTLFRAVTDKKLLDRLNSEPTIKVYRAMQLIDGKLYPPMSAKVDGKMREPIELGKWEQAEERPDLADEKGYFKLDKGNKTSLKARYNPYFHTSPTPLNDQFSSAQTRPELVTVEVEVPESELTSGYKAEKAKDSVGQMEWKAGVVQAKLSGTRTVILSRWDKPVRIVPDSEVADVIVDMFDGKDIVMPSNVVTPSLRAELEKRGVSFMETDNKGKPVKDTRFRATTGTPTEDVVENGLQLSVQNYARLAGDIFAALPENMRREVVEDTFRNGIDMQRAIMQIPTRLAEKDDLSEVEVEVAKMIAGKVQDALLADGVLMTRPLTTAEAIWMLYKHNNAGNDILSAARRSVVADNLGFSNGIIGGRISNEDDIQFRASRAARADSAARMYNTEARLAWRRLQESWQDMNVSVDSLMRALETASGKAIQAFENIAMALNRLSSKNLADKKKFLRDKLMPLWEKVLEISDKFKVSIEDIERYMMLKHGLERNLVLAARDARNHYKEELEKELSRIDKDSSLSKSEKKAAKAKAEATYQRHLKNIENGTDSEYLENRKKDYGGLTSLYSDYADYGTREDYDTEEEYQEAAKAARTPKYKTLEEAENAAVAEVGSFEAKIGGLTMELWHKVNAATKDTLKHQYNHGMLTKEQYESVRDMFEYYVPLRGFKDNTVEDMYSYYGSGQHNDFAKPLQAAKGRKTEAESPLGWIGSMAESAIQMDNKNDAKLRLYYLAVNRPDNDLMKITETWYEWTGDYNAEGKKIFEPVYPTFSGHLSGDSMQAKMDAFDSMMEQQAMQGNAFRGKQRIDIKGSIIRMPKTEPEHVVNVKVAGKDYSILINGNPRAAQAINGLLNIDNADANGIYRGFRAVLRMMSALSTSYNPEFWISNFQRDMMYAFIGTSIRHDKAYTAEFAKNYIEAFKVISMLRKNKKGALGTSETESYYKEFSENGGVTGYTVLVNNAEYDKMLREFQKDQQKSDFIKKVKSGFEAVADFGEAIEQVSRFAAYMTSRKMGKGIEESVNEAKEITVNFNRKGSGKAISWEEAGQLRNRNGKPLNWAEKVFFVTASGLSPIGRSVYMFFNASIQGLSAAAKLARNNPKKSAVWAGIFLSMGMLNAVLHAMLDDDDDYLDMPEYEKRTNLLIGGNGVYFKWALPQEVRPFYAMADIFVNHAMGRAPHKNITEELASVFADLLPVNTVGAEGLEGVTGALMPSYVSPIYQVIINKDFKGAPIYREMPWIPDDQQKDVPAYTKAYSGTGSLYVNVSEMLNNLSGGDYSKAGAININPAVVEHIVEGYGGGTLTTANKVLKSLGMIAGTEDISFRSMPFLSRILTVNDDRYRNAHTTELYNYYKGISDQAKRSYNAYEKQRDGDKLSELMRSEDWKVHQIFVRYKKMLDYYDKQLKLASTEDERRTIMREQDAQRKRVIEEISRLR